MRKLTIKPEAIEKVHKNQWDKIDLIKLADTITKNPNMTERQLSKLFDCSQASIWAAKQKIDGYDKDTIDDFSKSKVSIFLEGQRRILQEHLSVDRVKKMQPHQAALWFNSLYNNYRLETNQSTDNVAHVYSIARTLQEQQNTNDND